MHLRTSYSEPSYNNIHTVLQYQGQNIDQACFLSIDRVYAQNLDF